jgi:hypothetical protein
MDTSSDIMNGIITNDLILKYDENFNELYEKIVNINSSIMNKEELIIKENNEIEYKNINIKKLQLSIILIILFGILLILYGTNKITLIRFILLSISLFIIYLGMFYSISKYINLHKIEVDMVNYINNNLMKDLNYKCPKICKNSSNSNTYINNSNILVKEETTLDIDPQLNVWKYGDIPVDGYTSTKLPGSNFYNSPVNIPNYYNPLNEPKSSFGTTYPKSTYYQCEWLGGTSNTNGLPNNNGNKYSTIPCNFRQNYQETGRYICPSDPNKNGIDSCDNVSINF